MAPTAPTPSLHARLAIATLALGSSLAVAAPAAATDVGGTIGSQTWTPAGNPYHVTSDLSLNPGATLTIQHGVVVKFDLSRSLTVNGTLSALGTPADSIVFTSWRDDLPTRGGDSNGDGNATVAVPGDWGRIRFAGTGTNASVMRNCVVAYGGIGGGEVLCDGGATPTVRESRLSLSSNFAVVSNGAGPRIWANLIDQNLSQPIRLAGSCDVSYRSASEPLLPENVLTGNWRDVVGVQAGDVSGAWRTVGSPRYPYMLQGAYRIYGATLSLDPGVVVKMDAGASLLVESSDGTTSTLNATGTVSDSIVFTALTDDGYGGDTNQDLGATTAAPGYWDRIWFRGTNSSASTLRYCVIRYGGSAGAGNVYCANNGGSTAPTIRECRIEASSNYGLRTDGCAPKLYDSTLQWNGSFAVQVVGTTGASYRSASEPSLPEDVFQKNGFDAVGVLGGSSGTDVGGTWPKVGSGYPYVVRQNLRVYGTTLAISPGVVVKFNPVTYLLVESSDGTTSTLNATGTVSDSIVFTALTDDGYGGDTNQDLGATTAAPGYWDRIWFRGTNSSASTLRYCVVRYGGSAGAGNVYCANNGGSTAPTIRECRIEASSNYGLRTDGCAPKLYDSTLQWNGSFAVQVVGTTGTSYRSASEPSLPEDVFQKNGFDAVGVLGGSSGTDVGGTWPKVGPGYAYVVLQNLRIYGTTLAISPGVVVKFNPVTYLLVESSDGTTSTGPVPNFV